MNTGKADWNSESAERQDQVCLDLKEAATHSHTVRAAEELPRG